MEMVYLCKSVSARYSILKRDGYVTNSSFLLWPDLVQGEALLLSPAAGCAVSYSRSHYMPHTHSHLSEMEASLKPTEFISK